MGWEPPSSGTRAVAECITALIFDGLATAVPPGGDTSKATRAVDSARQRWAADATESRRQRHGEVLDVARTQFALRGFEATTMRGAALVDTGVGGPDELLSDWRVVNRTAAEALAGIGMSPADISLVINTHLHFDHCGQNAVFAHAPVYVQRAELARAQREAPQLCDWLGFMNAEFELLDGDSEILPGVSVITTPGHTAGHQSVVVHSADGSADLLTPRTPRASTASRPARTEPGCRTARPPISPRGRSRWPGCTRFGSAQVHFCHHTAVVHN